MLISLAVAAVVAGAPSLAPSRCTSAAALFRDVRAHTGGARWESARELIGDGTVTTAGLAGRTRIAIDLAGGATSTADDSALAKQWIVTSRAATWKQDLTLGVHPLDAPDARAAARTSAYLARRGYFNPADPATFACLADVTEDGHALRRVRIVPRNGRAVTIWVDPVAHVIIRTQEQAPTNLATVHYGAYRKANGLLLPHEIVETDGRNEDVIVRSIRTYRVLQTASAADFRRPPDPTNQRIAGDAAWTQADIDVDNGSPVVNAFVDGKGPLPFVLDTGGHAILTADAAKQLGITGRGGGVSGGAGEGTVSEQYARVRSLRIGGAEITNFPMFVIPYDKQFSDRGPAKLPLAGILGLEVFERFAVTIDYAHRTLRLQTPHSFTPRAGDAEISLMFQDDMPLAYASADGARGLFGVDTGNGGRVFLFGDYLRHHGFFGRYSRGAAGQSLGTGGAVQSNTFRLRDFSFGGLTMHNFVTGFVVQQKGSFSSRTEAGNFGHDVLAQFTLTADYARGRMYLRREPGAPLPLFTRTGLLGAARDAQRRVVVQAVIPGSPAADAGLTKGDVILAIDGTPTENLSLAELLALARRPVGTKLHVTVKAAVTQRDVTLTLRELLCNPRSSRCDPWVESSQTDPRRWDPHTGRRKTGAGSGSGRAGRTAFLDRT